MAIISSGKSIYKFVGKGKRREEAPYCQPHLHLREDLVIHILQLCKAGHAVLGFVCVPIAIPYNIIHLVVCLLLTSPVKM